jgi:hypothetical protein
MCCFSLLGGNAQMVLGTKPALVIVKFVLAGTMSLGWAFAYLYIWLIVEIPQEIIEAVIALIDSWSPHKDVN